MVATIPGGAIAAAGAIVNMDHTPKGWSVSKYGVYMTPGRKIDVTGGPLATDVKIASHKKWQRIKNFSEPLNIEIKQ